MYTFALQSWSLHPVILYSWLVGLTLILRFFNTLLVCQQKHNPILQTIDRKGIKKEILTDVSYLAQIQTERISDILFTD